MRRILLVLAVAALVAVMLVVMAAPALAAPPDSEGRIDLKNEKACEATRDIDATRDIPLFGVPPIPGEFNNCWVITGPGRLPA